MTTSDEDPAGQASEPAWYPALAAPRRRPCWKWLLIGLLLVLSVTLTLLYIAVLGSDIARHHWAEALDASRDAVPALVGWAALAIVCVSGGTTATERIVPADSHAIRAQRRQASKARDSLWRAGERVESLTRKLDELSAARSAAPGQPRWELDRELADTATRLDQARQWQAGALSAVAAAQHEAGEAGEVRG